MRAEKSEALWREFSRESQLVARRQSTLNAHSVLLSSIFVFQPFANVPVTKTSLGPFAGLPKFGCAACCPSSSFHLINVGIPSAPAPRSTAAANRFAAIVAEGTEMSGMGMAATGALNSRGGSRTAGDGTKPV